MHFFINTILNVSVFLGGAFIIRITLIEFRKKTSGFKEIKFLWLDSKEQCLLIKTISTKFLKTNGLVQITPSLD